MDRERVSTGTEWEPKVGYSRAIKAGTEIHVSGTTATDEHGEVVGEGDPAAQARQAIANVESALADLDADLTDVVRTRMFVTDIEDWEAIGRVHGDAFGDVQPATSMVEVSQLINPAMLVEIEAVAIVDDD
jgi:enamine deaminase RidA (YjgF/YER057c/UK114 family)